MYECCYVEYMQFSVYSLIICDYTFSVRIITSTDVCSAFLLLLDCSLRVKDVLREFDADGRLAQHRHGEVRGNNGQVATDPTTTHVCFSLS